MNRYLVIFTGGTIGSSEKDGYISTDDTKKYKLIQMYSDIMSTQNKDEVCFDTVCPYEILSENLNGEYINLLAKTIKENENLYKGIIVTHGTDTLQYTACGLSIMLTDMDIPVVLVSSNYILEDSRANGLANFGAAVCFLNNCDKGDKGIFISYNNGEYKTYIHKGLLSMPHAAYDDKVYSLKDNYYGFVSGNEFIINNEYDDSYERNFLDYADSFIREKFFSNEGAINYSKNSEVLWIKSFPGLSYSNYVDILNCQNIDNKKSSTQNCILLETFHSGTLCTDDDALPRLLSFCKSNHIKVYMTGVEDRTAYESTKVLSDFDINVMPTASPIAAYMLLWLVC